MTNLSNGKFRRKRAGQYHHGDLRQAVLEAAGRVLARDGLQALTMRAVAREVGVTHMAVHHHYPARRDLLAAFAARGYEQLGVAMLDAAKTTGKAAGKKPDAGRTFREIGVAYVTFAVADPSRFRVMFSSELEELRDEEPLRGAADTAFAVFTDALEAFAAQERDAGLAGRPADTRMAATAAWALMHGLSVLLLDRQLPGHAADAASAGRLARAMLREVRIGDPGRR